MIALRVGSTAGGSLGRIGSRSTARVWNPLSMSGELPPYGRGSALVLPGGVLFTDGTDTWYGEAR